MLFYIALTPLLFVAVQIVNLIRNYSEARKTGLPIILVPASFDAAWWMLLRPLFKWVQCLPYGLGDWYVYTTMGWPTEDGNRTSSRLGETFIICSPTINCIATCYPPAIQKVFESRTWRMPEAQSQLFAFYGQNVSSTNGADWQRHRKITATAFNENTFREVWRTTIKIVKSIDFEGEKERSLGRIRATFDVIAMQVLAVLGFGQDVDIMSTPPGHRLSLMESLGFLLKHIIIALLFNGLKAPDFILPSSLRRLKLAVAEVKMYMEEAVLRNMQATKTENGKPTKSNLLESMVKANEDEKKQLQKVSGKPSFLTESELYGNIFLFNVAGYETTASSMTFALSYLAAHPQVQDWVTEEVDKYYTRRSDEVDYAATYPKLTRCLSIMYETLRLASPAPMLVRSPTEPGELPVSTPKGSAIITVPPGMLVGGNFYGGHLSSRWGSDAGTFNPKRFVSTSSIGEEVLHIPEGPMFCPWIFGPRVCPGKKFSQVEFVALIAQIFSEWRVEIMRREGEDELAAKARLMNVLDTKYFNISTHLGRPEDAGVVFVRR